MKILIGDDQFGPGPLRDIFEMKYEDVLSQHQLAYTNDHEEFVRMAKTKEYDALMIDLRWGFDLETQGYEILQQVRDYAPVRVLWTSEQEQARELGYKYGATACIGKNPVPSELEKVLKGE
jgi:DNA-binding response OmpR family regulator